MNYYKDNENNIFAYEANQEPEEGLLEILEPIVEGKILPQHKNLDIEAPEVKSILEAEALEQAKTEADQAKTEALAKLTVKLKSDRALVFYADTEARVDLQGAIDGANLKGLTSTPWKLAEEFEGQRIVEVSLDEIREASALALEAKANLIGIV